MKVPALFQSQSEAQGSNDVHAASVEALAAGDNARAELPTRDHFDRPAARLDETLAGASSARDRLHPALTLLEV